MTNSTTQLEPIKRTSRGRISRKLGWALVLGLMVLASAEFVVRGPMRFARATRFNDFISPYIQAKAWSRGMDPYSPRNLVVLWPTDVRRFAFLDPDLADGTLVLKRGIPTAYPPTSLVLLSPFAWLPWLAAHAVWLVISVLAYGITVLSLVSLAGFGWQEQRTYAFLALALALAPVHTGLAAGNIVIVAIAACALAVLSARRQQSVVAGVLIAVAVSLKPQVGLPFLVYYLLRRRWRISAVAVSLVGILAAVAILRLAASHAPWVDSYRYNNKVLFASGSLGDFTEGNPLRYSLVNLQVLTYTLVPDRPKAIAFALTVSTVMGLAWLLLVMRRNIRNDLLEISAITVLSLLPLYHRLPDASLLVFPLSWSLAALSGRLKPFAIGTLILILAFLVPGGSALEQLQRTNHLGAFQHSWWWTGLVMPYQVWALLLLSVVLLLAMRSNGAKADL